MFLPLYNNHSRITYCNNGSGGRFLPHPLAATHIDDRGLQFSDGVYEVIAAENSRLIDEDAHYKRFARSLKAIEISAPVSDRSCKIIIKELFRRNNLQDAMVYIQVTRGIAKRDHYFPKNSRPTLLITIAPLKKPKPEVIENGISVITAPDLRWLRRDIKSISLLPNILAKQKSLSAKAKETWLIFEGVITEGSSTNAYIVKNNVIKTHPKNNLILGGVTRETVLGLARKNQMKILEKPFTLEEALRADEAFLTATTTGVLPIVEIDGSKICGGKPGPITKKLMEIYNKHVSKITKN